MRGTRSVFMFYWLSSPVTLVLSLAISASAADETLLSSLRGNAFIQKEVGIVDAEGAEDLAREVLAFTKEKSGAVPVSDETGEGKQLRRAKVHGKSRTVLDNFGDVQYVGSIKVGGQAINGVLDTGSFDLLVFSAACEACGNKTYLYDHTLSRKYEGTTFEMRHSFGSGDTWSREARDSVEIGNLVAENQPFWEVFRTAMPVIRHAAFQAIVGLGPMRSAARLAKQQHEVVLEEEREYMQNHNVLPIKLQKDEIDAKAAVQHSRKLTGLLQNIDMHTFSVCIGKKVGSSGVFVWNDDDPRTRPDVFTQVSNVNSMHWVVKMTDVRIGHGVYGDSKVVDIGCGGSQSCGVIMDTGTSLLAAPTEAIGRVRSLVDAIEGNCSRVSELPNLQFNLGGNEFSLPPEAYIGRVEGTIPTALSEVFHLRNDVQRVDATFQREAQCQPLLMSVDADTMFGQMWIFGLPFFRRYYTTFDTRTTLVRFGSIARKQVRNSVFIAPADEQCNPRTGTSLLGRQADTPREIITVDLSQVRFPNLDQYESDGPAN